MWGGDENGIRGQPWRRKGEEEGEREVGGMWEEEERRNMSQLLCDDMLAGLLLGPEKLTALHVRPMVIPYRYNSVGTSS